MAAALTRCKLALCQVGDYCNKWLQDSSEPHFTKLSCTQDETASRAVAQAVVDACNSSLLTGRGQALTSIMCGRLMTAEEFEGGGEIRALTQRRAWVSQILRLTEKRAQA